MAETMIERVALAIWRKREEGLPDRLKRCTPDNMDRATGAWSAVQDEARAAIEALAAHHMPEASERAHGAWSERNIQAFVRDVLAEAALTEPHPAAVQDEGETR